MNIIWKGSPNKDSNRLPVTKIIIHWFGDNLTTHTGIGAVDNQFQKPNGTSAHYAVENTTIHQYVKETDVAYHAGNYPINQESIGIEHSAGPNRTASEDTYRTSAKLISEISKRHGVPLDRQHIKKHSEVKATQCCGSIDIDKLIALAKVEDHGECEKELDEVRASRDKWKNKTNELEQTLDTERKDNAKTLKDKNTQIESLQHGNSELTSQLTSNTRTIIDLRSDLESITQRHTILQGEYSTYQEQAVREITALELTKKIQADEIEELKIKAKGKLSSYSKLELLRAVIGL